MADKSSFIYVYGPAFLAKRAWNSVKKEFGLEGELPPAASHDKSEPTTLLFRVILDYECPPLMEAEDLSAKEEGLTFAVEFGAPKTPGRCRLTYASGNITGVATIADSISQAGGGDACQPMDLMKLDPEILLAIAKKYFTLASEEVRFGIMQGTGIRFKDQFTVQAYFNLFEKLKKVVRYEERLILEEMDERFKEEKKRLVLLANAYHGGHDAVSRLRAPEIDKLLDDFDRDVLSSFEAVLAKVDPHS